MIKFTSDYFKPYRLMKNEWPILLSFLILVMALQIIPVRKKGSPVALEKRFVTQFKVPANVNRILEKSCYDCHSDQTNYPWYGTVQPIAMLLQNHITEGKQKLNFDELPEYGKRRLRSKFREIVKQIEQDKMPLNSYLWLHADARLSASDKKVLIQYFQTQ